MSSHALLQTFAGLGLFFVGINFLSDHLKECGRPYVKKIVSRFAGSDLRAILSGIIAGGLTNSGKAVTFSLVGMVSSGALSARRCMPIIIGGSFGSSLLVLWVTIDFAMVQFALLGIAGLYYQFGNMKKVPTKFFSGLAFGLGLVLFGLEMLKHGASTVKDNADFLHLISSTHGYWFAAFVLGAVGAFVTQSGATISLIAITFLSAGLLDFDQTVMFVYGTNVGSGFSTAVLGYGMSGTSRQLVYFHATVKIIGSLVLVPLLYVENYLDILGIKWFAALFTAEPGTQVGAIYITYELMSALALLIFIGQAAKIFNRFWPASQEEALSQPHFVTRVPTASPTDAVTLILKEQVRILHRSPRYLAPFRGQVEARDKPVAPGTLREANSALHVEIQHHIAELMKRDLDTQLGGEILHLHATQKWLSALDKYLFELAELMGKAQSLKIPVKITTNIIRSVDVLLGSARLTVAENHNWAGAQVLIDITSKRETLVSWFRSNKLEDVVGANLAAKKTLLEIIVAYERLVWIFNQLAHTMLNDAQQPQQQPAAVRKSAAKRKLDLDSAANESWPRTRVVTP
ncbi:MAG: Na/Pi cotransporter family protein [Gammaproteobacteria bacterium]|nr:Na/Pi cotransporter family protein [Gammaproteobacteria bacterium]